MTFSNEPHIICCTKKLLDELKVKPLADSGAAIQPGNEWHATMFRIERRKCLLFTHSATLYSFVAAGVVKKDLQDFSGLFWRHLALNFSTDRLDVGMLSKEDKQSHSPIKIRKTNNRRVLGSMNDFLYHAHSFYEREGGFNEVNPLAVSTRLNGIPMGMLKYGYPIEHMRTLLDQE